jgi:16S rRNA (guanine527-N7)-methyltransferase
MQSLQEKVQQLLGLSLSPTQIEAYGRYADELADWNQSISLTAISEPDEVLTKHFLDSLSCWLALREHPAGRVIDVGSGAGFPGLALKILHTQIQLTLVESVSKKAAFLEHMVQVLGLNGVTVISERAEAVGRLQGERESYDWAIARALAPLVTLAEYLLPFVRKGGFMLAQKGAATIEEVEQAQTAIKALGGGKAEVVKVDIPDLEGERYLVIIEKVKNTPKKYPRRVGIPSKRPL